jgi:hypothetical protein
MTALIINKTIFIVAKNDWGPPTIKILGEYGMQEYSLVEGEEILNWIATSLKAVKQ